MLFVYCRTVGQTIGTVCRSKQTDEVIISILGRLLVPRPKIEYSSLVARTRIINQCKGRQFVSHPDEVQTNFPTPAAAFHYSNTSAPKFCTPYFVLLISYRPVRDLNSFMGFFAGSAQESNGFPVTLRFYFQIGQRFQRFHTHRITRGRRIFYSFNSISSCQADQLYFRSSDAASLLLLPSLLIFFVKQNMS
jgi:hypothetical protein